MSLTIVIPAVEQYDEVKNEFVNTKEQVLQLEHSLVSIRKWETMHLKPFLGREPKTRAETIDYIRCMTLTQNVDPAVYSAVTQENIDQVEDYINAPMTATTFPKDEKKGSREIVTAEIIYYWMIVNGIPFECQKWHLNSLLTLINVCNRKSKPPKKMSKREIMRRNTALNDARRKQFKTRG